MGGLLKVLSGGSFPVNGTPFAFYEAGVLFVLPWAKAKLGAATANAANTASVSEHGVHPPWIKKIKAFRVDFCNTAFVSSQIMVRAVSWSQVIRQVCVSRTVRAVLSIKLGSLSKSRIVSQRT
jgi:uncharacterized membrane protein